MARESVISQPSMANQYRQVSHKPTAPAANDALQTPLSLSVHQRTAITSNKLSCVKKKSQYHTQYYESEI